MLTNLDSFLATPDKMEEVNAKLNSIMVTLTKASNKQNQLKNDLYPNEMPSSSRPNEADDYSSATIKGALNPNFLNLTITWVQFWL